MTGLLAGFESEQALRLALERMAAAGLEGSEPYTPTTRSEDREPSGSPLPLAMFVAGILGFVGFFLLMSYADVSAYPIDVGGRPRFAWPAFVPIAFELGVLCAMITGFFGFFVLCRMPRLYDPIDECAGFREASREVWFLAVRSDDAQRLRRAREILAPLGPISIEEFPA